MPTADVLRPIIIAQGQLGGIVYWTYVDISDGTTIIPTGITCRLYDPNGIQRDVANTSLVTTATFTPTFDTTGTITGTTNAAYFTIGAMSASASIGVWVVETTYTHELVTSTMGVGFNVSVGGATVGTTSQLSTVPVYAFYKDVENFLNTVEPFDQNSTAMADKIDNYIVMAEGEFEARTGKAYKPRFETNEIHNMATYRTAFPSTIYPDGTFDKRPIHLLHGPILPFDATRGHKLELYRGSEQALTSGDPIRRWDDYLTLNYGRNEDFWFDEMAGRVFLRNTFFIRRGYVVRVTYEWGKPITTLTSPAAGQPTTINVGSTHRYETRGLIRIGRTYIFHTGKTATSFTGCQWGVMGTQSEDYSAGSEVYSVPDDVRSHIAKRAAAMFLQNESFVTVAGDGAGTSPKFSDKIDAWNEEWERWISQTHQRWNAF